ncbi:DUF4129 domain-containing protein [Microbacterium betulae]|uniref:DUF4129 domain-containing protein n=1 Tax=Microbacterium betulae TaxID=2981139 RepID=A0AA97FJ41_9MICO|nr:DUF4129 domain-containing protein [Microbacterium sp. AB]WOF24203.1 DUF4129 domain-containing protein [Microbacterium sp. AB]
MIGGVALSSLLPDGDEARDWAEQELSDPAYDAAEPNLLDRVAGAIGEFLSMILNPQIGSEWSPLLAVVVIGVIAAVVVAAFLVWGRPRAIHRAEERSALLFGDDERRSAAELRASADRRAAEGDWDGAVVDRFRAIARALEERDLLDALPGTTAQQLARTAASPFPSHAGVLASAARVFDDVRYLRRSGTAETHALVARLDGDLARSRPVRLREGAPL